MEKLLGKIEKVRYGQGGYDDAMFGLSVTLSLDGGHMGVADFKGFWAYYPVGAKYSREEWEKNHLEAALFIMDLLKQAKKRCVTDLPGVPVEATIEDGMLREWRVLTEVL